MCQNKTEEVIEQYKGSGREALIPILQDLQDEEGYLPVSALKAVSRELDIPLSKIYGVASFYNQFKFNRPGRFHIQICCGTACHVKGSAKVLDMLKLLLKIEPGQTTRDGLFSLEIVSCVGVCSLAPVVCVNDAYHAEVKPEKVAEILNQCKEKDSNHGTN